MTSPPADAAPSATRTSRFASGVALGAANQVLAMLVGLWLTRFALDLVGQSAYGLWLVGLQVMAYVALTDLGVVAVLPRQTAFAFGSGGSAESPEIAGVVGATARLVLWQVPVVAVAAVAIWLLIPAAWAPLRLPLALVLAVFVLTFPARIFQAVLQGMQDLAFLGWVQLAAWTAGTVVVVGLLVAGLRLGALAAGWAVSQLLPPLLCWRRLAARYPRILPRALPRLRWAEARVHLARAIWVSISQVASSLVSGADVLIVGALLGPAAVVPYACTAKLVQVAANFPTLLAHTAGPALSEMRMRETRGRLLQVTAALTQAVMIGSGAIACVVLAVNRGFVSWWVGPLQFGGAWLTGLFVLLMLVQHWGTTVVFTVFCFGHERRLALTGLAQGGVTVLATLGFVKWLGLAGGPLGMLAGAVLVSLPATLPVLARETGTSLLGLGRSLAPWLWRFALLVAAAVAIARVALPTGFWGVAAAAAVTAVAYAALMRSLAMQPALRPYVSGLLERVRR